MRPIHSRSAVLWVTAAAAYFLAEAVSATAFPGYSYATNYISDLGVPGVGTFQGRAIDSPLHAVMNVAFIAHGLLFALAAVITVRRDQWPPRGRRWFLGLAVAHAVGIILVGVFHGSEANARNGLILLHVLGAAVAIVAGNVAAIVAGRTVLRGAPGRLGPASVALGVIGLVGLLVLVVESASTVLDVLPEGVWERTAVYAILVWELLVGAITLTSRRKETRHDA